MSVTIGTDPELMLREKSTGRIIAACGMFGGEKGSPISIEGMPENFGLQEDNVMLEFNTPAATTARRFAHNVICAVEAIANLVERKYPELELDQAPCRVLMSDQLASRQAMEFGCSPDFSGHNQGRKTSGVNPQLLNTEQGAWRFNGGHVHVGYERPDVPEYIVAQFADVFLGLASIGVDQQGMRRKLYGSAGRFRPVPYGIEYRTLSNFWIWNERAATEVGDRAIRLGEYVETTPLGDIRKAYTAIPWVDVEKAINSEDVNLAGDVLTYCNNDLGIHTGPYNGE